MPPFELEKFVAGLDGLTDAQRKTLEGALKPVLVADAKVGDALGAASMARSDYSRNMDQLAKDRTALEAKIAEETRKNADYHNDVTGWWNKNKAAVEKATQLESALRVVNEKISVLKTTYAIEDADVKPILDAIGNPAAAAPGTPAVAAADSPYATKEQVKAAEDAVRDLPFLSAELHDLSNEHKRLYGTELPNAKDLFVEAVKAGKSLREFSETKFNFPARRQEMADEAQKAHDAKLVRETEERIRSEQQNPAARQVSQPISPVLTAKIPTGAEVAAKDPRRGIAAAMNSFGSHGAAS